MADRLSILTQEEIHSLYSIPKLDDEERSFIFELDEEDKIYLQSLKKDNPRKINYILQLGYYRAVNYFFRFSFQKQRADVEFILKQYFPNTPFPKKQISKNYHYDNRTKVMEKFGFTDPDSSFKDQLLNEAKSLAKRHVLPKFVLQSLLTYCLHTKVIRPGYSSLQDLVGYALKFERNRLINKLYTDADKELRDQLDKLLANEDLFYNLTLLKRDQKDFSTTEIKKSVLKQQTIIGIYKQSKQLVPKLGISEQNIIYYADLAEFYTIQKIKQFKNKNQARLYIFCYAYRRLLKINDHLVVSFTHKVQKYTNEGDDYQRTKVDIEESIHKALREQASEVLAININESIPDEQVRETAFKIIPKENYKQFLKDFKKPNLNRDYYRWESYEKQSMTIKRNLRPLFKVLDFSCAKQGMSEAIAFLKDYFTQNSSFKKYRYKDVPLGFFPKSMRRFLAYKTRNNENRLTKKIDGNRYEFMVYLQVSKGLSDGTIFVKDSNNYRALEDELIDIEYWAKHKKEILSQLNMPLLSMEVTELLNELELSLEEKYRLVNDNIRQGKNPSIKIKYNKKGELIKWTLPYTRVNDDINNPFYEQLPITSIGDVLQFTADSTGYLKSFTHLQPLYAKTTPDPEVINACIVANATGTEIKKMKAISDVKGQDMDNVNKNFIRWQTLCSASDAIVNHTSKLPIFKEYNLTDYGVHASVDGQKFATKYNTIKSRYSKKYFGMMKGVVKYSLIANHLPLCLKMIGANEHESHFLLDIVESNTSDVEIKGVSGDMHSINRVNFALLYMFGYQFMPRFTKLGDKSDNNLVCFGNISDYEHLIIKPSKQADKTLIIKEWDNVLRIFASLALKKTTQSQIVRKLSSYKTNPTLKAMIALDEIIMSEYLLKYIDLKEIRTIVQGSLCRGESYNQLSSTIAKVSGGRMLNGKNEIELDINAESIRLIANAVIFYNASLLSKIYEYYLNTDPEKAKKISRLSPVAWQHLSFIGKYEFYNRENLIDIQRLTELLLTDLEIDF
ncbi:MAG: Tn3 family transposase [Alteromonadaceae bacterium]|nr:Tn3 family transposase [Alteromonadaceae bacterium]